MSDVFIFSFLVSLFIGILLNILFKYMMYKKMLQGLARKGYMVIDGEIYIITKTKIKVNDLEC